MSADFIVLSRYDAADEAISLGDGVYSCFTDGPRLDDKSGSGYVVYLNDLDWFSNSVLLGDWDTVLQAEVQAFHCVVHELAMRGLRGTNINIFTNSQAALRAVAL